MNVCKAGREVWPKAVRGTLKGLFSFALEFLTPPAQPAKEVLGLNGPPPASDAHPGPHRHKALTARAFRDAQTQRAGIAPPHAAGDGLSGVTSDGGLSGVSAFISVPA